MGDFTVVYDACVLYPAPLRDLLMHLAVAGACNAKWSEAIHDEWTSNLLKDRPDLTLAQMQRTRSLMNERTIDALVAGYEALIPDLNLPDAKDRHVLAVAIHCRADAIVTFNLRHFPTSALAPYGKEALHPDEFVCRLVDENHKLVCLAANRQRSSLKRPPKSVGDYLTTLEAQRLPRTAA